MIDGTSLNAAEPVVTVDGVACEVTEYSFYKITCITGEKESIDTAEYFVGQHGLRHEKFDGDFYSDSWNNFENNIGYGVMDLMTTLEIASTTTNEYTFDKMSGYFKAPLTGQYQFHQSCDDRCRFYMSLTDPMDPTTKELLMDRAGWTVSDYNFRSFGKQTHNNDPDAEDTKVGQVFTEWI